MYFIEKFPWILDLNLFSDNSSSMQNLSIDSSTISSESADQSSGKLSAREQHRKFAKDISSILYEVSTSENKDLNPLFPKEKHFSFRDYINLHKNNFYTLVLFLL